MTINTEPSKGGKISVYIDGEYLFTVSADTWYSLDYTDGCEIDEDELEQLKFTAESRKAYAQALRFLTLRAHSEKELYRKLLKNHSARCAEFALQKCRELGFLDDEDFAARYAEELMRNKRYGLARIRSALYEKGIDREITDKVIKSLDFDAVPCIIEVIEKKYLSCLNDEKGRKKATAALIRLGYSYGDIKTAFDKFGLSEESQYEY